MKVKGYQRKIPVIYGIDYTTHDIPSYLLSRAENYASLFSFFQSIRLLNYPLQAVVCDDNANTYEACKAVYPQAIAQLCHNHYKENIRQLLGVRTNPEYQDFMRDIETILGVKRSKQDINKRAGGILRATSSDPIATQVLMQIHKRQDLLFAYHHLKGLPITTNLIECFNSHLEGRLKTIKGFQSFKHADLWLNGYFLRRRTKPFTDCSGKFKKLNGRTSLSQTLKTNATLPFLF